MRGQRWGLVEPGKPLRREDFTPRAPGAGEVLVRVQGCGVCHTDLAFADGEVKPRAPLPIVLGHEISGTVLEVGAGAEKWKGQDVVVAAITPCGDCAACSSGRGNMCARQFMPGNDGDGGFATHVTVRAAGLSAIPPCPTGMSIADFAVIGDAVTTALQAIRRAKVADGDLVVVVGAGGVGAFAVQCAAAAGARVVALDVSDERLAMVSHHGAAKTLNVRGLGAKEVRDAVRAAARALDVPAGPGWGWKIVECSGTPAGQESAWSLLGPAATLAIVGFTREAVSLRLSNLMAFDADAFGTWGCPVERYPEAIAMVASGEIQLRPFVRHVPLDDVESALQHVRSGTLPKRTILVP